MKNAGGSSNWKKCASAKRKTGPGRRKSVGSKRRSGPAERLKKRWWSSERRGARGWCWGFRGSPSEPVREGTARVGHLPLSFSPQHDLPAGFIVTAGVVAAGFAVSQGWHLYIFAGIVFYRYIYR